MFIRTLCLLIMTCLPVVLGDVALAFERGGIVAERIRERIQERRGDARPEGLKGRAAAGTLRQGKEKPHESAVINGVTVALWRPSGPGRHPLVVFSHGFNGCNTQSTFLTEALAANGYFVVAPNHADAKLDDGLARSGRVRVNGVAGSSAEGYYCNVPAPPTGCVDAQGEYRSGTDAPACQINYRIAAR